MLGCQRRRCGGRDDHVDVAPDQVLRETGQPREVALGRAVFDDDVLTLDPAKLPQRPQECVKDALDGLAGRGAQITDAEDFRGLLRLGGKRCGKKCRSGIQEVPAVHSMHALIAPGRTAGSLRLIDAAGRFGPSSVRSP